MNLVEKAIWLDIVLLCCMKIQMHTRAISNHIAFSTVFIIYLVYSAIVFPIDQQD